MTASAPPSRDVRASLARLLSTPEALGVLFIACWLLRLWLATKGIGMKDDMGTIHSWTSRLVERGPAGFYPRTPGDTFFVDYPPVPQLAWWGIGRLAKLFGGQPSVAWLKMPGILGDLALAWLVGLGAERFADRDRTSRVPARFVGAAAVLLNPAFIFLSAVWGQIDSLLAAFVLGALLLLGTGTRSLRRDALGMAVLGAAFATKSQAAFVFPIVGLLLLWRYAARRPADHPERSVVRGLITVAMLGAIALATVIVFFVPFGLSPAEAFRFYRGAINNYAYIGLFAFNFWGAISFWRPAPNAFWTPDNGPNAFRILGVPANIVGLVLCVILGAIVCVRTWRALRRGVDEGRVLLFGSIAMWLVIITVLTRIHDRYIFVPLALGAVFVTAIRPRVIYAAGSVVYLGILWFAYVYWQRVDQVPVSTLGPLYGALFGTLLSDVRLQVYSALVAIGSVVVALFGWRALRADAVLAKPSAPT